MKKSLETVDLKFFGVSTDIKIDISCASWLVCLGIISLVFLKNLALSMKNYNPCLPRKAGCL